MLSFEKMSDFHHQTTLRHLSQVSPAALTHSIIIISLSSIELSHILLNQVFQPLNMNNSIINKYNL